jgi:5'-nucleotidase
MEELVYTSRRKFIGVASKSAALVGLAGLPSEIYAKDNAIKITILHTNDTHSRIDPFPDNDPKFPGMGGVARRLATINKIRSEEKNVLLFDSGDIFQGTPYFNFYGGELEIKLMSKMGYDAATMGNHDFDNGIEGFIKQLPHANFPFLTANYNFKDTLLNKKTLSYTLFEKQDVKIGVFGIGIELKGLVDDKCYGKTIYNNPLETANQTADFLRKEKKCDLVICLSHLGYKYENNLKPSDEMLATQSRNIDLILGGHTHTFLDTPVAFKNILGNEVLVAQTGWAGIRLGRIDYFIEKNSRRISKKSSTVKISKYSS